MEEETRIKIEWCPAYVEKWLNDDRDSSINHKSIHIDSYEVAIFPAESVNNIKTLPAKNNTIKGCTFDGVESISTDTEYR